ncbi:PAS domain-containing sensor histidine kinase [Mucilaginibacter sp. L3T2-6]|uniref:PAS domain-containing sensor histidine kinase n=1 Tax=Mucilaginibacter sp. L3T2-6 TaxID=3062491 RepID=UPI002674D852|nr:PAS domain-containing sensor histidine kinase [Mucilaginibacter sp. L3T2-6]MDO3644437.1 PAS domain-containing sensor histidine kinase [Mucilaginibacter sp. L3T2-6]MDV6216889.1 PAS domain-containing sensor histidine kinase [Mucilaginibacter sp. L3T2-6]
MVKPSTNEAGLRAQNERLIRIQREFKAALKEYSDLFEHSPVGYFILNKSGIIEKVNKRGSRQLGMAKKDILHNPFSIFLHTDNDLDTFNRHMSRAIENAALVRMQCEIKKKDGVVFTALIKLKAIKDEKRLLKHLLSIITDISQIKAHEREIKSQLSRAEELNTLKSDFIGMASHEFRTPLTSMLSSTTLIEQYVQTGDTEKLQKHLGRIKLSIKNLVMILDEFLSIEKLESGKVEVQSVSFNLPELCTDLIEEVTPMKKNSQVIEYQHNGDGEVTTDHQILQHIVLNLLSNGCKYSGEGKEIKLFTYVADHKVKLIVQDSGIGIPEAEHANVFTRFFRAHNTRNIQGTGLGLHIVKRYVDLISGDIGFVSKDGEGTTFTVTFPQVNDQQADLQASP